MKFNEEMIYGQFSIVYTVLKNPQISAHILILTQSPYCGLKIGPKGGGCGSIETKQIETLSKSLRNNIKTGNIEVLHRSIFFLQRYININVKNFIFLGQPIHSRGNHDMNKPEHTDMNMVSGDETWIHYFETVRKIEKNKAS